MATDLEAELDALYGGAFETFVEARNRLAQTLKKEGRADESSAVKGLAKPSLAAWSINQLHRKEPKAFAALLAVGDALRGAEGAIMRGGDALRAVTRTQREHVDALQGHAKEILVEAGHNASDAVLDKIAHTLRSLAVSGWGEAAPGRLAQDLTPPGLDALVDALGGLALPPAQRSPAAVATGPAGTSASHARKERVTEASHARSDTHAKEDAHAKRAAAHTKKDDAATKREAERARREAEEAVAKAELAVGRAERELVKAKENVGAAASAAKKAHEKAEAAQREADEAAARAEKADAEVEAAREELASAEAARDEAAKLRDAAKKARAHH